MKKIKVLYLIIDIKNKDDLKNIFNLILLIILRILLDININLVV